MHPKLSLNAAMYSLNNTDLKKLANQQKHLNKDALAYPSKLQRRLHEHKWLDIPKSAEQV